MTLWGLGLSPVYTRHLRISASPQHVPWATNIADSLGITDHFLQAPGVEGRGRGRLAAAGRGRGTGRVGRQKGREDVMGDIGCNMRGYAVMVHKGMHPSHTTSITICFQARA